MAEQEGCLGAALLDNLPNSASLTTPSAWRRIFHAQHTEPSVYAGMFICCRSGRDWALRIAPQLTITLHPPTSSKDLAAWEIQLGEVHQALSTRGPLPVSIIVRSQAAPLRVAYWMLVDSLSGVGQGVSHLGVFDRSPGHDQWAVEFLYEAAAVLPNLASLDINGSSIHIPPPTLLPKLKKLHAVSSSVGQRFSIYHNIAAYLPQLTNIDVSVLPPGPDDTSIQDKDWPVLFVPRTTFHTLTHFSAPIVLGDTLVGILLDQAPQLTHLQVGQVWGCAGVHRDKQWGLQELTTERCGIPAEQLCNLPRTLKDTPLHVNVAKGAGGVGHVIVSAVNQQGLHADVAERLPKWQLDHDMYLVVTPGHVVRDVQPMALLGILHQVRDLRTPAPPLCWADWQWSNNMADMMRVALPAMPLGGHGVQHSVLTDALLGPILRMGTAVRWLVVAGFDLRSDAYADAQAPWEINYITDTPQNIASLLKMPARLRLKNSSPWIVDVTQEEAVELIERLSHTVWASWVPMTHRRWDEAFSITYNPHAPKPLAVQLSVLQAVRFRNMRDRQPDSVTEPDMVKVCFEWPMCRDSIIALRLVPAWVEHIDLGECQWPEGCDYLLLAQCIPTTCKMVSFHHEMPYGLHECVLDAMYASGRWAGRELPRITVSN